MIQSSARALPLVSNLNHRQRAVYLHIDLSIDPEAMNCPVGSNRAANISPECPVNSITGDCRALVRGPYCTCQPIVFSQELYFRRPYNIPLV